MRICLIMPKSERIPVLRTAYSPPLGLMSIGAYVRQHASEAEVCLVNAELLDECEVLTAIVQHEPDIIGITTNVGCYRSALHLAKKVKQMLPHVITILGGPYVSSLWKECLRRRSYIDFCVVGDGEIPMARIAGGEVIQHIPGIAWRDSALGIVLNEPEDTPLDHYNNPDWLLVDTNSYQQSYKAAYGISDAVFASIYSMKGCSWRVKSGGCIFCGLVRPTVRKRSPERVWQEIESLKLSFGCNHFWELSDTICSDVSWLRHLAKLRADCSESLYFRGYARSAEITEEVADLLSDIGFKEMFIGVESGDDAILRATNKGSTARTNIRATRLLARRRISTFASIVLGLPGETTQSLDRTYDHVISLFEEGLSTLSVCVFTPYPGSRAFTMMVQEKDSDYQDADVFTWPEFAQAWVEKYCKCNFNEVMEALARLSEVKGCFYEDNFAYVDREYDIN